jgi:hypothetical protein
MPTNKFFAMTHWMFNCKNVSEKVSMAMDQILPLHERIMIFIHMWMCQYCRRFKKQMFLLRKAMQTMDLADQDARATSTLSPGASDRIRQKLSDALNAPIQPQ